MKKFKQFLKWPALCISSLILITFTIVLIVTCTKEYSIGTYTYEETMAGITLQCDITLDEFNNGTLEMSYFSIEESDYMKYEFNYKIINGKLFGALVEEPDDYAFLGTIDAFEIEMSTNSTGYPLRIIATNNGAVALKVVSIVLMSVFGATTLASIIYIYLSKKKSAKTTTVDIATTSELENESNTSEQNQ